jgi:hypothetical protein
MAPNWQLPLDQSRHPGPAQMAAHVLESLAHSLDTNMVSGGKLAQYHCLIFLLFNFIF